MKLPFNELGFDYPRLGLVVLQTDQTLEDEFRQIFQHSEISLFHTRIPNATDVTPETLYQMHAKLPACVQLLPEHKHLDVVGYACTSGATIIGSQAIASAVQSVIAQVQVSDPLIATKRALNAIGAKKIAFVTPYIAEVSAAMREQLVHNGQEIVAFSSFEQGDDSIVARISPESIYNGVLQVAQQAKDAGSPCDAVFISCTNLKTLSIIARAEKKLNIPVISSNLALAWDMARLAKIPLNTQQQAIGKLFQQHNSQTKMMQVLKNPHRGKGVFVPASMQDKKLSVNAQKPLSLLKHCPVAKQTDLFDHTAIAQDLGVASMLIKDERSRMGLGSFKATGAAYVIASQACEVIEKSPDLSLETITPEQLKTVLKGRCFICSSAGNHGLSIAAGAKVFGAKSVIYLSNLVPESFAERLRSFGTEVVRIGDNYEVGLEEAKKVAKKNNWTLLSDTSWEGYTDLPTQLMEGYLVVAAEMLKQCEDFAQPTHILLHAGVGGIAGAACAYIRDQWGAKPKIIIIEPEFAPAIIESIKVGKPIATEGPNSNMGRLDCKEPSHISFYHLAQEADYFVTVSDEQAQSTVDWLKQKHQFATSPSAAASLAMMFHSQNGKHFRNTLGIDENSHLLTIVTEGEA